MSGPYDEKDAAKDTDIADKEVAEAWHAARDDRDEEDNPGEWGRDR